MPRYLQVTPQFNPISYEERIKPLEQYKQEYDKRMDAIDEQGLLADAIGGLIDENQDPELAQIYNEFSNKLTNTATDIVRTGSLGNSRRALRELRSDYANKLVPIQTAYNDRAQMAKEYRDAVAKDPTYIGTDPLNYGLKEFMKGKSPNDHAVSGAGIYKMAMESTAASSARNVLAGKWGLSPELASQYFGRIITTGFNEDTVREALKQYSRDRAVATGSGVQNVTDADAREVTKALSSIVDAVNSASQSFRIDQLGDENQISAAMGWALRGALNGITYKFDDDYKNYNPSFWTDAEIKKLQLEKARREANPTNGNGDGIVEEALSYGLTPLININGNMQSQADAMQLLSDFISGRVGFNTETGRKVTDKGAGLKYDKYGNLSYPYVNETYGDRLYDLASGLGLTNIGKEDFAKFIEGGATEQLESLYKDIASEVNRNAQQYSEAYSNITDLKYWVQTVNNANQTFVNDKGKFKSGVSLIKDNRGNNVDAIPDGGSYRLPVRSPERKGIAYDVGEGKDKKRYYISTDAFSGASVNYGQYKISLKDAINYYYNAIDSSDSDDRAVANYLLPRIMDCLAAYSTSTMPIQGATSSYMNPVRKLSKGELREIAEMEE